MTNNQPLTWSAWVTKHLTRLNMSNAELARRIGVTRQRASAIGKADNLLKTTMERVEKVFGKKYPN